MARVLIVDDEELVRKSLLRILEMAGHSCWLAANTEDACGLIKEIRPEVVLLDVLLPGDSGIDLAQQLCKQHSDVAVIMVTGVDDPKTARTALACNIYGYLIKPIQANEIIINVEGALHRRQLEMELQRVKNGLELEIIERTVELTVAVERLEQANNEKERVKQEIVRRLAKAAEFRDIETAGHIERMSRYCELIASRAGLEQELCQVLLMASPMHDVGKIGVPDSILLKPGKLTPEEFSAMKRHTEFGYRILAGSGIKLLDVAAMIAQTHHERWDGAGYPLGLKGSQIPVEGRIAAIADVFDSLVSKRVYKAAIPFENSLDIMKEERGTHFDPKLLDTFFDNLDSVQGIMTTYPSY